MLLCTTKTSSKSKRTSIFQCSPFLPFILCSQESSAARSKYWSRIRALNSDLKQQACVALWMLHVECTGQSLRSVRWLEASLTFRFPHSALWTPSNQTHRGERSVPGPTRQPLARQQTIVWEVTATPELCTEVDGPRWPERMTAELQLSVDALALQQSCVSAKLNYVM